MRKAIGTKHGRGDKTKGRTEMRVGAVKVGGLRSESQYHGSEGQAAEKQKKEKQSSGTAEEKVEYRGSRRLI